MQVVVETVSHLERKMKVSVPFETIDLEVNNRVKKLCKTARIDGFRPGKIPESVIRQQYGKGIEFEALNDILQDSLEDALRKENLKPASTPEFHFDAYETGKPFDYTATFEIFPAVELKPFGDLIIEKLTADISDEDIDKTLEGMRKQQTKWEEVDRPSKEGDRLSLAFVGSIEGKEFDGGKADNMPLVLGSKSTIPGFEDGLIGTSNGQNVVLDLSFPENYGVETLKGKPVQFNITVKKVEEAKLPDLDDEFAKLFGIQDGGIEKLRGEVRDTVNQQLAQSLRQKLKNEVMSKLFEQYNSLEVPKALVQRESEHLMKQAQNQFSQMKGAKPPQFSIEMFSEKAKERVVLGLVINEIVKRDDIKPNSAKVRELITNIASRFDHPEQVVSWYYQQKDRMAEMETLALEEQIVDQILTDATIVEKATNASELLGMGGVI